MSDRAVAREHWIGIEGTLAPPAQTPPRVLTVDARRSYGSWAGGGRYRVRIFEGEGVVPVVVCTQLEARSGWCISAVAEYLAASVMARYLRHRLEEDEPAVWLEHYPCDPARWTRGATRLDIWRVTFRHWRIDRGEMGGQPHPRVGEPAWAPLDPDALTTLLGDAVLLDG